MRNQYPTSSVQLASTLSRSFPLRRIRLPTTYSFSSLAPTRNSARRICDSTRPKSPPMRTSANARMASLLPLSSRLGFGGSVRSGEKASSCSLRLAVWLRRAPASASTVLKMARLEMSSEERLADFCFFCFIMVSVWKMSNFSLVLRSSSSSSFFRLLWAASSSSISLFASSKFLNLSAWRLNSPSMRLACSTFSCSSPMRRSCSSLVDCLSLISFSSTRMRRLCSAPTRSSSALSVSVVSNRPSSSRISFNLSCQRRPGSLTWSRLRGVGQAISLRSLASSLRWNWVVMMVSLSILMSSMSAQRELSCWRASSLSSTSFRIFTTSSIPERQLRMSLLRRMCGFVQHSRRYSCSNFRKLSIMMSTCANSRASEPRRYSSTVLSTCWIDFMVSAHSSRRVASSVGSRFTNSQALSTASMASWQDSRDISGSTLSADTRSSSSIVTTSTRPTCSFSSGLPRMSATSSSPSAETIASSSFSSDPYSSATWSSRIRQNPASPSISAEQSSVLWMKAAATASKSRQSLELAEASRSRRLRRCGCSREVNASGRVSRMLATNTPAQCLTLAIWSWQCRRRWSVSWWRRLSSQYLCWQASGLKQALMTLSSSRSSMLCRREVLLSLSSCTRFLYLFFSSVILSVCWRCSSRSPACRAICSSRCSISSVCRSITSCVCAAYAYSLFTFSANSFTRFPISFSYSSFLMPANVSFSMNYSDSANTYSYARNAQVSSVLVFNCRSSFTRSDSRVALDSDCCSRAVLFSFSSASSLSRRATISLSVVMLCSSSSLDLPAPSICAFLSWTLAASRSALSLSFLFSRDSTLMVRVASMSSRSSPSESSSSSPSIFFRSSCFSRSATSR